MDESELFADFARGGLLRCLAEFTTTGDRMPYLHVFTPQRGVLDLLTDAT